METQVLSNLQIEQKINRIAFQIIENNFKESKLFVGGISGTGSLLAKRIQDVLIQNSDLEIEFFTVTVDKQNPLNRLIETSIDVKRFTNGVVILVDDVLNSGTTLIYSVRHFLDVPVKQFKTAVLVDRSHKKYPVKADFKGISLSTSIQETVEVELNGPNFKAVLK